MSNNIIDRRQNGKNHSAENRQKFLRRQREAIREAVKDSVTNKNIKDIGKTGTSVSIKRKTISEPTFSQDSKSGDIDRVYPGNDEFLTGDTIQKPPGGEGSGGSEASDGGEGEDDFLFQITREEFLEYFFEDLALPNLVKTNLANVTETNISRAGFASVGIPSNLDVVRSMRQSIGRRFALRGPHSTIIAELQFELDDLSKKVTQTAEDVVRAGEIIDLINYHEQRKKHIPFLDTVDLRYRQFTDVPRPITSAVVFCIMDVSGSMGEHEKDMAKRFFTLLYLFLYKNYEKVDIRFIRHHSTAKEVDEEEFFHSKESGGTVVSTALELTERIIASDYSSSGWNVYIAQASDGDNWGDDTQKLTSVVSNLLTKVQYFAYIEVISKGRWMSGKNTDVWNTYENIDHPLMNLTKASSISDIYPVFRELFGKEASST